MCFWLYFEKQSSADLKQEYSPICKWKDLFHRSRSGSGSGGGPLVHLDWEVHLTWTTCTGSWEHV